MTNTAKKLAEALEDVLNNIGQDVLVMLPYQIKCLKKAKQVLDEYRTEIKAEQTIAEYRAEEGKIKEQPTLHSLYMQSMQHANPDKFILDTIKGNNR